MDVRETESFCRSLQSTLTNAQKKIDTQQEKYLQSLINLGDDGMPEYISWHCDLLAGDGSVKKQELLRIPLVGLFSSESLEITELSIDFNCDIKKQKKKTDADASRYLISPLGRSEENQNQFRVNASIEDDYLPEVTINEEPIDDYLQSLDAELRNKPKWYSVRHKVTGKIYLLSALVIIDLFLISI